MSPYLKTTYSADMVLNAFDTPFRKKWMIAGIIIFFIFPFMASSFFVHIANLVAIACIGALGMNLVLGTAGMLSLGHAGFMCAGAFTAGALGGLFHLSIWITIVASALVGAILGLIAGLPSFRLKSIYLAISTLALHYIIYFVASEIQFTAGASNGLEIDDPSIGIVVLSTKTHWYFFLGFFLLVTGLFIANLLRSRPGRAWVAIRDREIAARVMGIHVGRYKILAFVISSAITAIAGALYAYYINLAAVEEYTFLLTITYLAMVCVGGLGSILGTIFGAILITLTPHLLMYLISYLDVPPAIKDYFFAIESAVFGGLIIFFLMVEPLGLLEMWRRIRTFFELWPFKHRPLMITKR